MPDDYLSLIIDGMNTVLFPISIPIPKATSRIEKLKLHIHGIIDHGHKKNNSMDHWITGLMEVIILQLF